MAQVAVAQMTSCAVVNDNLKQVERFFSVAKEQEAQLLLLPENFAFMGMQEGDKLKVAENYQEGEIQQTIIGLAKKYQLWVVAGTIPLRGLNGRVRSSCLVFDDRGFCAARYDKIHLFDAQVSDHESYQESLTIERGDEPVVVDTPIGRLGLTVCYDLRFPELFRQLAMRGAEVFSVPSAFTAVTGAAHWEVLLRARAIENLCYVLAPNQEGHHQNGRDTYGHSMIVEPWGSILAEQHRGTGLITAKLDNEYASRLRRRFPIHEHHVL